MARPLRVSYPGAFYHITARGNERKQIFSSDRDRQQFLSYLESAHMRYGALFHGYCLMAVSYTHLRAHETVLDLVCRLLLEKKNNKGITRLYHTVMVHYYIPRPPHSEIPTN